MSKRSAFAAFGPMPPLMAPHLRGRAGMYPWNKGQHYGVGALAGYRAPCTYKAGGCHAPPWNKGRHYSFAGCVRVPSLHPGSKIKSHWKCAPGLGSRAITGRGVSGGYFNCPPVYSLNAGNRYPWNKGSHYSWGFDRAGCARGPKGSRKSFHLKALRGSGLNEYGGLMSGGCGQAMV